MQTQAQKSFIDEQFISLRTITIESDSLYEGHNYNYYYEQYREAKSMRIFGIVLTSLGVGAFVTGVVYMNINFDTGTPFLLTGFIVAQGGGAIWIVQSIKVNKNRNAMEQIKRSTSLSFGATDSGVGLVLRF